MSRPIYETDEDLAREGDLVDRVCRLWRCEAIKLPRKLGADFIMHRDGTPTAVMEIKTRRNASIKFKDYAVSLSKLSQSKTLAENLGVPFLLVVGWTDRTGWMTIESLGFKVEVLGRKDRGDPQDVEPQSLIPVKDFRWIRDDDRSSGSCLQ